MTRLTAWRAWGLLACCAIATALYAATPQPELQELDEVLITPTVPWPLEDYLEFPKYDSVVISPRGTHLATGWSESNFHRRLNILDWPSMKRRSSKLLQIYMGVTDVRWLDEERLLLQPDWPLPGFWRLREPLGTLLIRDIDGHELQQLHPTAEGTTDAFAGLEVVDRIAQRIPLRSTANAFGPVRVIAARPGAANQMLFQTVWNGTGSASEDYGVYRLDISSCGQTRIATLPMRGQVITGPGHRPALVGGVNEAGERVVYYLPEDARTRGEGWQLRVQSGSGERGLVPVAWTGSGEEYYALDGRDSPTRAVVVWNARNNTQRPLYRHADADMEVAWLDPAGKPWMFSGVSHDPVYWYPDAAHPLAQLHSALVQHLPHEHVDIMNATDDLATAVVRVTSGSRPTMFLVVDVRSATSLTAMHTYPKLRGKRISPVDAVEFPARDGLMLRGFLTRPVDAAGKPRRNLPLLVISHNKPRDEFADYRFAADYQYDFERQLFASRGYAVLQVNARGTGGRGKAFEQAGDGEWGRGVQDDFADAVRWAIKQGVTATGRVCFYGTGWGAYSALMTAARAPELFQCVIGVEGVYDLARLSRETVPIRMQERAVRQDLLSKNAPPCRDRKKKTGKTQPRSTMQQIQTAISEMSAQDAPGGIPLLLRRAIDNDVQELEARSPISNAAAIKAKVLLIQPALDPQAAAMQQALQNAGNPARSKAAAVYYAPEIRAPVYESMLTFLGEQIGL
jgi:dipeptidyl aminopeptidase/acylaminoacyl peptidase